jgi:DNA gyrase subunit A
MSRQSRGRNIVNLLKLRDQQVASIINVSNFDSEEQQLVMATKKGLVKKTRLSAYSNPRTTGVIAINLDADDYVIGVVLTTGSDHIILGTRNGMTIKFDEKQVRSMGRVSRGVIGIRLRESDAVVDMVIAEEKAALLTVCQKGYGKRTGLENYRMQNRGGVGLINIKTTARNGKVVALKTVQYADELMMITAKGIIIRTGLDQIRSIGRNTQGVRLIKMKPGDELVAAAKIISEEINNSKQNANNKKPDTEPKTEPKSKPKLKAKPKQKSKQKPKPKPKSKNKAKPKTKKKKKSRR